MRAVSAQTSPRSPGSSRGFESSFELHDLGLENSCELGPHGFELSRRDVEARSLGRGRGLSRVPVPAGDPPETTENRRHRGLVQPAADAVSDELHPEIGERALDRVESLVERGLRAGSLTESMPHVADTQCGVQGLVWPQDSSDRPWLTSDEILEGMEVIARAAKGTAPALVLGVQADDTESMLVFARHAEKLGPDAMIAMPPKKARSIEEYREYFTELCRLTSRPVFIQTSSGAPDIEPTVDFIVELGEKFPHSGYIKEEFGDTLSRMKQAARHRPGAVKRIFAEPARAWTYEMRLGTDGMMTGGPQYAEVYVRIWQLHLENRRDEVRDLYSKLMLITNLEEYIPGLRPYLMKQRGIFKTHVTRRGEYEYDSDAIAEIAYNLAPLEPAPPHRPTRPA